MIRHSIGSLTDFRGRWYRGSYWMITCGTHYGSAFRRCRSPSIYRQRGTPLSLVVNVDVADEIILGRISDRWVHLPSGRVYNLSYNPPKVLGLDDETGEPLTKRPDDNPVRIHAVLSYLLLLTYPVWLSGDLRSPSGKVLCRDFTLTLLFRESSRTRHVPRDAQGRDLGRDLAPARERSEHSISVAQGASGAQAQE